MILAYTYYNNPWKKSSGDDERIHTILSSLAKLGKNKAIAFNLSFTSRTSISVHDGVVYVSIPRRLYLLLSKITGWDRHYDLNPLAKLTHYVEEFIAAIKLRKEFEKANAILVFGSMSLFSFYLRLLGVKKTIVYDALANYAQTLYLRSHSSLLELLKYGLYLLLHKLEVKSSDIVVYPSKIDLENATRMFKPRRAIVVPNPAPICYESLEEYANLRARRKDFDKPYFILLAGGRGKNNEEAVRITIEVFNDISPEKFKLFITGPWQDMKKYVKNPSIQLLGVVPKEKLKELLAISDYGLSPVFRHCAGTFLKVLSYISAGLDIIASRSIVKIDIPKGINVNPVRNRQELARVVEEIISRHVAHRQMTGGRHITSCRDHSLGMENLLDLLTYTKSSKE